MSELMELLELRQAGKSNEQFANEMGLRGSTLWRYHNGKSDIDSESRRKMVQYFSQRGDMEMVGALLIYKTGSELNTDGLQRLGKCFLDLALTPSN